MGVKLKCAGFWNRRSCRGGSSGLLVSVVCIPYVQPALCHSVSAQACHPRLHIVLLRGVDGFSGRSML